MKFRRDRLQAQPQRRVEGWYWYACSVGTYSDCRQHHHPPWPRGSKGKTQMGFENSYKFDKTYDGGGPILGPWPVLAGFCPA